MATSLFTDRAHGDDISRRDFVKSRESPGTVFKMFTAFKNWFAKCKEFGVCHFAMYRIIGKFARPTDIGFDME